MAALAAENASRSGLAPTYTALGASNTFPNDGRTLIYIKNVAAGGTTTIAFTSRVSPVPTGLALSDPGGTIADGAEKCFGPFPVAAFNDQTTGLVTFTVSETTNVTGACIALPAA